jgi:hypothetical protein
MSNQSWPTELTENDRQILTQVEAINSRLTYLGDQIERFNRKRYTICYQRTTKKQRKN